MTRTARHFDASGRRCLLCLTLVGLWVSSLAPARAQPAAKPIGPEFQVNSFTTDHQTVASAGIDGYGNFVVAWRSSNQDGDGFGIFAQRFAASGTPLGVEFQVNTVTASHQNAPALAMNGDGSFVVAWHSTGQDGSGDGVFGQRFAATGAAQGVEFQINTYTSSQQRVATAAMDGDGDFVVAWQSSPQDGGTYGIFAQRFDSSGTAQGLEFQVNTHTISRQDGAAVAIDDAGDFVVTWADDALDGDGRGVFGQRFDAAGTAQGSAFQVNTATAGSQSGGSIGMDADGDFVVAWSGPGDGSLSGVFAQRFGAAGGAQGGEFRVNSFTDGNQVAPRVARNAVGEFVIVWSSSGQDGSSNGVFGQFFSAGGATRGAEFAVNAFTTGSQSAAAVEMTEAGDAVIVWSSVGQDGDLTGVFARRVLGPCSESLALVQNQWYLIGLPCEPPAGAATVLEVFGDDLPPLDYAVTWAVVRWDAASGQYEQMLPGDELVIGEGYWIKTLQAGQTIDVEGNNVDYQVGAASRLAQVGGGHASPQLAGVAGNCTDSDLTDGRFNMMGFPFRTEVLLAGALVDDDGAELTFPQAEVANVVSDQIWTWSGAAYQAADSCTPGLEATLSTWDGFWVDVCDAASTLAVIAPAKAVDLGCDPPLPPIGSGEEGVVAASDGDARAGSGPGARQKPPKESAWYLRLVASSGAMSDPGNVLGELADSVAGWDRHDLLELPPFGTSWLTVVFPHLDWGADSSEWYTSDYHGFGDPREWSFEVRSDRVRQVTLTWELTGDPKLLRRMELVDQATGATVPAEEGNYTFTMAATEHPFSWQERRGGRRR